jgi:alkylhydroperoxidase family enzyme
VYKELERVFNPGEIIELTFVILAINSWNRRAIGFKTDAGLYVSSRKTE